MSRDGNLSLTEHLSAFLTATRAADLPPAVLDDARYYTLDWLGSAIAGTQTEPGRVFLAHARQIGGSGAEVVGLDGTRNACAAALINGGLSHIVEMDDVDRGSVLHPGAVVIPAALAVAEREGASGLDFLCAVVLGYEVAIRIGEAVGKAHYRLWHSTATCGVFGSTAAAGWLVGLSAEQMTWALGNAGTMAAGLWEFNADGAMSKHLHAGRAASSGVLAADFARLGLTGARRILEGERGFFAATSPDARPERVVAGLRPEALRLSSASKPQPEGLEPGLDTYRISGVSIKPHASCRHTHPGVDAALALRAQLGSDVAHISQITVETYQAALDLTSNPAPQTPYEARFSLPYCVATGLVRGSAGLADFTPEAIAQPDVRALMGRVSLAHAPDIEARYPAEWPVRLAATLDDGRVVRQAVDAPKGDPENPLSWAELEDKFRAMARGTAYEPRAETLIERVRRLDGFERAGELWA